MKKIIFFVLALFVGLLVWFLGIKKYDYRVDFVSPHGKWISHSLVQNWMKTYWKNDSIGWDADFNTIYLDADSARFMIEFEAQSDATSQLHFYTKKNQGGTRERLKWIFGQSETPQKAKEFAQALKKYLEVQKGTYKLGTPKLGEIPAMHYAYNLVESTVPDKAHSMMGYIADVMGYIRKNELELTGDPFLQVVSWDIATQKITYKFCFPIAEQANYPPSETVQVEKSLPLSAIHTTFNGDYRFSSYAWYQLLAYANENNLAVEERPLEIFRNDPHAGGEALEWKADVYLPIKKK